MKTGMLVLWFAFLAVLWLAGECAKDANAAHKALTTCEATR